MTSTSTWTTGRPENDKDGEGAGTPSAPAAPPAPKPKRFASLRSRLYRLASDIWAVTQRNLIAYTRIPEAMVFSSIQPIMFVLLIRYVFGGAIPVPGYRY